MPSEKKDITTTNLGTPAPFRKEAVEMVSKEFSGFSSGQVTAIVEAIADEARAVALKPSPQYPSLKGMPSEEVCTHIIQLLQDEIIPTIIGRFPEHAAFKPLKGSPNAQSLEHQIELLMKGQPIVIELYRVNNSVGKDHTLAVRLDGAGLTLNGKQAHLFTLTNNAQAHLPVLKADFRVSVGGQVLMKIDITHEQLAQGHIAHDDLIRLRTVAAFLREAAIALNSG